MREGRVTKEEAQYIKSLRRGWGGWGTHGRTGDADRQKQTRGAGEQNCVVHVLCLFVWAFLSSVLLQDEVFQLVGRPKQKRRRLPVASDQLTHSCDLRLAELGRCPAPSSTVAPPTQAVIGGGGGR